MNVSVKDKMFRLGIILGVLALFFFGIGMFCTNHLFDRIMLIVCAFLLFCVGGLYIYMNIHDEQKKKMNLFLYDPITKRERMLSDLTFEDICDTLDLLIPVYAYSASKDAWFDKNVVGRYKDYMNNTMIKVIYYRLLYLWIEGATNTDYDRFGSLTKEDVEYVVGFMSDMGEYEISSKIYELNEMYDGDVNELRLFFNNKKEYLRKIITDTVIDNIEDF
ncbi:MAG: hypothetical protein K6G26_10550 [Lachnospiraceae bacterium]|nr:hypothetical protein [Lachnospiraceae bacterium]